MYVTSPISWPIAKCLDHFLGEHQIQRYDNTQLKKLIKLHSITSLRNLGEHVDIDEDTGLTENQVKIIEGALTFSTEACQEVMTKIDKVDFMLTLDQVITFETLKKIKEIGFSRVPVCEKDGSKLIIAFLLTKSLIGLDCSERKTIK